MGVSAAAVFAALSEHLPADAVVAVDVGNHAYSLGRYLESKGQPVLIVLALAVGYFLVQGVRATWWLHGRAAESLESRTAGTDTVPGNGLQQ